MLIKRDYTMLPVDTKIENGTIQVCPDCGQRGLMQEVYGKKWYTHCQILRASATKVR
jgi:uncharacterized protein (DUF983 family)